MASQPTGSQHTHDTGGDPMEADDASPSKNTANKSASPRHESSATPSKTQTKRTLPADDDFVPDIARINLNDTTHSRHYWEEVLGLCNDETRLNVRAPGKRDVFALGSVIVKSDHQAPEATGDYSAMDENECVAVKIVASALQDIQLPQCYLRTNLNGRDILIQSRIRGSNLQDVWPHLTREQKLSYKEQARDIIRRIHSLKGDRSKPSYFVETNNPRISYKIDKDEYDILFDDADETNKDLAVAHNNMVLSNIFVDSGRIVGLAGWSKSGYFGWDRVKMVHSTLRCGRSSETGDLETDVPWHDLYDIPIDSPDDTKIKTEAHNTSLETVPRAQASEAPNGDAEFPTPKKVTDLKRESMPPATSSERSSPAPSTKGSRKRATAATKKGSATRKPALKKRKLNDAASTESVSRRGSATPAPSRTGKAGQKQQKQSSLSVAGTPAPEENGADEAEEEIDDDDIDPSEVFCICRKPDNHTWMIACDGGCDDWYHGKCVNIKQSDADLIDKYICPLCEEKHGLRTTWKPMCRLRSCRKPARVSAKPPSKYCSDEHGREFMLSKLNRSHGPSEVRATAGVSRGRQRASHVNGSGDEGSNDEYDDEDEEVDGDDTEADRHNYGSRGGVLTKSDLKAAVSLVSSAEEFRKLGGSILASQPPEIKAHFGAVDNGNDDVNIDLDSQENNVDFTPEERLQIQALKKEKARLRGRADMLRDRDKFLALIRQQAKHVLERLRQSDPKGAGAWKDICGFDPRLSWCDEEFDEWRASDAGKKALDGALDLPESMNTEIDGSGDTKMADGNEDAVSKIAGGVCVKRRCEQHRQWLKVQQQDILFEQAAVRDQLAKCERNARAVIERVVLRLYGDDTSFT
ncbi:hypothetical protein VTO42DRAFT_8664 [Malbranchea cinnamomea]